MNEGGDPCFLPDAEVTEASGFVGNFATTVVSGEGAR